MLYHVKALFREEKREEFYQILTDGTVEKQRPDGKEICASMRRAAWNGPQVEWYETCYCNPPLQHERSTIYDRYFTSLGTTPISEPPHLSGASFWAYLSGEI